MNVYGTEQIRNVVLLGHGGAGKTTVAEALALLTGVTKRMGKVPDGNTISDYDKEEIKRQFSISTTLIPLEYAGEDGPIKINLLDTPGFTSFYVEDMDKEELRHYFREFIKYEGTCRFQGCTHTHEPGCAVLEAVEQDEISESRYVSYLSMMEESGKYR